jgi:small subunit ribosomal protein S15
MGLLNEKKQEIIKSFAKHEADTGSAAVQVALLSERVAQLTEHLNVHKQDFSSQRGLRKLVGQRRRLLKYLRDEDLTAYKALLERLGIRGV